MEDWQVSTFIYTVAFAWMARYNLSHPIMSDRVLEYGVFNAILDKKSWLRKKEYWVLPSCLTVTLVPALLYQATAFLRWKPKTVFKITPNIFYALAPAFVYLTSRQYLDVGPSVIVSLFLFSNFFFLYYPDIGRIGPAIGFLAGLVWALLTGQTILVIVFTLLIIASHYGVALHTLFVVGLSWLVLAIEGGFRPDFMILTITSATLTVGAYVWYFLIAKETGAQCREFVTLALSLRSATLTRPRVRSIEGLGSSSISAMLATGNNPIREGVPVRTKLRNALRLSHRDPVLQVALGRAFLLMETPRKIELLMTWLMVSVLTMGMISARLQSTIPMLHIIMAGFMMFTIGVTVVLPHASVRYGTVRVYMTALMVLAPCFVFGTNWLSDMLGIHQYILPSLLIGFYALCVSGEVHWWFGIDKRATQRYMESMVRTSGEGTY